MFEGYPFVQLKKDSSKKLFGDGERLQRYN
jgi:hypothetical protein